MSVTDETLAGWRRAVVAAQSTSMTMSVRCDVALELIDEVARMRGLVAAWALERTPPRPRVDRSGCWCDGARKPCEYHEGVEAGIELFAAARVEG